MKSSIKMLTAAGLLGLASIANASLTTWDLTGHLVTADASSPYLAGDSFEALVTFDTAAVDQSPSNINRHSLDLASLKISYQIGTAGWQQLDASAGGLFYLRDNQPNPGSVDLSLVDGLTFSLGNVSLILRWNDLTAIDYSQHLLPSNPPALTNLATNSFQENTGLFLGKFDSISAVPEPESAALLLAGLGLVAFVSRRRAAKQVS